MDTISENTSGVKPMNQVATVARTDQAVAPQSESAAILSIIERAATDPAIDVDKMERLLAMHERISARNAEQAFNEAMKEAQEAMPQVVRDAENSQTHSKYSRLETLAKVMNPVITRYGFSMSFGTDDSHMAGHYRVTCKVSHTGGHSRDYHADIPVDDVGAKGMKNKTLTHAFGSSMSYGRRYLTLLIFNVTMKDEDDDGNRAGSGAITDDQKETLVGLIKDTDTDTAKFLTALKLGPSLDAIPAKRFMEAKNALMAKQKALANGGAK